MKDQNFNCCVNVDVTAHEAFKGIGNVSGWWAKNYEGHSDKAGDVFTVHFGKTNVTFKLTEVIADKKVVWLVTNCHLDWLEDKKEWNGTQVVFELSPENGGTKIDFTHIGLVPEIACYNDCRQGWTGHVMGSLPQLLTTGKGRPE